MNLKELRIWHHNKMMRVIKIKNAALNRPTVEPENVLEFMRKESESRMVNYYSSQAEFHLMAILAITEAIGGSVEQDKKDALEMAALINPNPEPIINKDFSVSEHDAVRKSLYGNPKAQTVPEKIRSIRTDRVRHSSLRIELIDPEAKGDEK